MKIADLWTLKGRRMRVTGKGWYTRVVEDLALADLGGGGGLLGFFSVQLKKKQHAVLGENDPTNDSLLWSWRTPSGQFWIQPLFAVRWGDVNCSKINMEIKKFYILFSKNTDIPASNKMTFCSFVRISLIFDTRLATPPKHLLLVHGDANWKEEIQKYK